jgi:hypothetical protein
VVPLLPGPTGRRPGPRARFRDPARRRDERERRAVRPELPRRARRRLDTAGGAPGRPRAVVDVRLRRRGDPLPPAAARARGPRGRPVRAGRRRGGRGARGRARRDVVEPDHRAARPLSGPGVEGAARLAGRARVVAGDPPLLGRRDAPRAVRQPTPRRRQGARHRPRLAHRHLRERRRRGRPLSLLRGHPPEAGRELPGDEPLRLQGRLRRRHADRDAGRDLLPEAVLLRGGGPGLLADLRGPRRRLPPGFAVGRLHRVDAK